VKLFDNIERIGKLKEDFESKPIYAYDKARRVKTLKKLLKGNSGRLLDVGCSNGHYYSAFREMGFKDVSGLDISEKRLAIARERGYKTFNARAQEMPFENEAFDVVTCIDVLVHVLQAEHQAEVVKECGRVLKKGGVFVYTIPNRRAYLLRNKINCLFGVHHPICDDYCRPVTLKEALDWADKAGLGVVEVKGMFYQYPEAVAAFTPLLSVMDSIFSRIPGLEEYGMITYIKVTK